MFATFNRRRKQACSARVAISSEAMITLRELSLLNFIDNAQNYSPNP